MLISAYGLFWRRDEIDWTPGKGQKGRFRLLGRSGTNLPGLRVCDFRSQIGIYILYGNLGAHYVGLARRQDLGVRLKQHLSDQHSDSWDRFSWFGFKRVLRATEIDGLQRLSSQLPLGVVVKPEKIIGDVEALLIYSMAVRNVAQMRFARADEWRQIKQHEVPAYLSKVDRRR